MEKKQLYSFGLKFGLPLLIGIIIANIEMILVSRNIVDDVYVVRALYTFSNNFIGFLKWFAPVMSLFLIASGIRELKGQITKFLFRFTIVLITSLFTLGLITVIIAMITSSFFASDLSFATKMWPETYFDINYFTYFDVFTGILLGIALGVLATLSNVINQFVNEGERLVSLIVKNVIIKLSPLWIMGSYAASTIASSNNQIILYDMWLSFVVLVVQICWLAFMYKLMSKLVSISFKSIVKAGSKIFGIVVSMAGMTSVAIFPYLIDEQKKLGLNESKAKFVTVASFNMPGSLVAHIIFATGLSYLFGLNPTFIELTKYMVVLNFILIVSPAISGGVFAITSPLLAPMLGFTDPMIGLMSTMYFKQGTTNAAVNNAADFYLTGLAMDKEEFLKH